MLISARANVKAANRFGGYCTLIGGDQPSFGGRWANMIGATPFWRAARSDDVTVIRLLKEHDGTAALLRKLMAAHNASAARQGTI